MAAVNAKGKVTFEFLNTDNEKFTETPFYVDCNLLKDDTATSATEKADMITANSMLSTLVAGTMTACKLTYEVPIV